MLVYVMRHGPAEDRAPSGRDFDRRLTPEGRALVQAMAAALRAQRGRDLARVLASPRERARETATIVREALGSAGATIEIDERLGGEQPIPWDLVHEVVEAGEDALLVGHQPAVEELCRGLIQPYPLPILGFRTATIVALEPNGPRFRVASFLDPRQVEASKSP